MKPHIDPKVDCVFKALLGSEEHKSLLLHFLNAVFARDPGLRINSVDLLNPYNEREFETDKLSVVDVKARDAQGRIYQIEIQLELHPGLTSRMLYTWSTIYHRQIEKGKDFDKLKPVIAIWLLNETLFDAPDGWHLPFVVWNREHEIELSADFRLHLLQLPIWQKKEQPQEDLDRWMYLFTQGEEVDIASPPAMLESDEMKEAMGVLQHFSENDRQYFLYQQRLEAECLRLTWENAVARAQEEAEQAKDMAKKAIEEANRQKEEANRQKEETNRQKEETKRQKQELKQQREEAKQAKEDAKRQAILVKEREAIIEQERREKEEAKRQAEQEKEHLLALLKQAGIDPNQQ